MLGGLRIKEYSKRILESRGVGRVWRIGKLGSYELESWRVGDLGSVEIGELWT